jgi:hypothetical protein
MRLFLVRFCVSLDEAMSDNETSIAVGIAPHFAIRAEAERCARSVAANVLPLGVTHYAGMTAMAFPGCVARVDPARDDPLVPRLIFGVVEDPPLHPERSFHVAPAAILALFGLEVSQVFKHQNGCPLLSGKLDNTSTHQMGNMLIHIADLAPEVGIVLLILCNDARL